MGIKICPKCGGKVSDIRNLCIHCGYVFPSKKKCPDCEELIDVDAKECPICGHPFSILEVDDPIRVEEPIQQQKEVETKDNSSMKLSGDTDEKNESSVDVAKQDINEQQDEFIEEDSCSEIVLDERVSANEQISPDEGNNNKQLSSCPYCNSTDLVSIGIDSYMCGTCKGKFVNATQNEYDPKCDCANKATIEENKTNKTIDDTNYHDNIVDKSVPNEKNSKNTQDEKPPDELMTISTNSSSKGSIEETNVKICKTQSVKGHTKRNRLYSKKKIWIVCTSVVTCVVVVLCALIGPVFIPLSHYNSAMSLLNDNVDKAIAIFDECSWWDSTNQTWFAKARKEFVSGNLENGIDYMHNGSGRIYAYNNETMLGPVDSNLSKIPEPSRTGYSFSGWSLSNYNFYSNNYYVDLHLSPKWTANLYSVSVSSNNIAKGTVYIHGVSGKSGLFKFCSSITIKAYAATGHSFIGWYENNEPVSDKAYFTFTLGADNVSFIAKFN